MGAPGPIFDFDLMEWIQRALILYFNLRLFWLFIGQAKRQPPIRKTEPAQGGEQDRPEPFGKITIQRREDNE